MARWIIIFLLINDAENYSTLFFFSASVLLSLVKRKIISYRHGTWIFFHVGNFLIGVETRVETFCDGNHSHIENYASREYGNGEE